MHCLSCDLAQDNQGLSIHLYRDSLSDVPMMA